MTAASLTHDAADWLLRRRGVAASVILAGLLLMAVVPTAGKRGGLPHTPGAITDSQARSFPEGFERYKLVGYYGGPPVRRHRRNALECLIYDVYGSRERAWRLCFDGQRLAVKEQVVKRR